MNIGFTVVSRNYLPAARALAQSFLAHNAGWQFCIGLLERKSVIVTSLPGEELLYVEDLGIPEFEAMNRQYSIFELSCALKPFYAHYFFVARGAEKVIYLDSDILLFSAFRMFEQFPESEIFLTPHLLASDGRVDQYELHMLQGGIYNGGFVGLRQGSQSLDFLTWWKARLAEYCYQGKPGLFVDQVWLNHVPAYFTKTCIVQDPGYNVAYWNLPGRRITGNYRVNESNELVFFHYSGYKLSEPERMSVYQELLSFSSRPDVKPLFEKYAGALRQFGHDEYAGFKCTLGDASRNRPSYKNERNPVLRAVKKVLHKLGL
jgi:hypothetical protein